MSQLSGIIDYTFNSIWMSDRKINWGTVCSAHNIQLSQVVVACWCQCEDLTKKEKMSSVLILVRGFTTGLYRHCRVNCSELQQFGKWEWTLMHVTFWENDVHTKTSNRWDELLSRGHLVCPSVHWVYWLWSRCFHAPMKSRWKSLGCESRLKYGNGK